MAKSDIARNYRDIYGVDIPTRKLASIMYEENKSIFPNIESARDALRYIEGKKGKESITRVNKNPNLSKYIMNTERPKNPFELPIVEERNREPFVLPLGCNNILVLADLHIPYYHVPSVEKAIEYGLDNNINCVILLGDVLDNHQLSSYEKDPSRRSQEEEMSICKEFFRRLKSIFDVPIYWAKGNHDMRWEHYIRKHAKDLATMRNFQLESVLALHEENIHIIDDKTIIRAGNLTLHHGHYLFGKFGSENPGKALVDKTGGDFMIGHLHRHISFERVTINGIKKAYILGCLSEIGLNVDYNPLVNQYRRGFAHVVVNSDKSYEVKMIDGY